MTDRSTSMDRLALGSLLLLLLVTAAVYPRLPDEIPIHFNAKGVADGFARRSVGAWCIPGLAAFSWLMLRLGSRTLPAAWAKRMQDSPLPAAGLLLVASFVGLQVVVLHAALTGTTEAGTSLGLVLGSLSLGLALVLPKIRRNPFLGIRTPWALTSDENWARTHRVAGYTFAAGGVIALATAATGQATGAVVALITAALAPAAYSFVLSRWTI